MRGFPKHLNSKADYEYVKENFLDAEWRPAWQALLDGQKVWVATDQIDAEEDGTVDDTHKVVPGSMDPETPATFLQLELQADDHCKLLRLGFTADEVEAALA